MARKERLARSLSLSKLKFPFPNMMGVCVREASSGRHQLLSQGTGEILLDSCVDFWDGQDLCPLTVADRFFFFISLYLVFFSLVSVWILLGST